MQTHKEKIRKQIRNAACDEFLEKGFRNASMRSIAKKAKVTLSNIYNYFSSKEEIYHSLTNDVAKKVKMIIPQLKEAQNNLDNDFLSYKSELMAKIVGEIIKTDRKGFILIMNRSEGTKYENFKKESILKTEQYFFEHFSQEKKVTLNNKKETFVFHIIANNLIEGLLEIAKYYENDKWVNESIELLMKYHLYGILRIYSNKK